MAISLKQVEETYEIDTEEEMDEFLAKQKELHNVTRFTSTYKYLKGEEREFWTLKIRKETDEPIKEAF